MTTENQITTEQAQRSFRPLFVVMVIITLAAAALEYQKRGWPMENPLYYHSMGFMTFFMGVFFVVFALLKLVDLASFAKEFRKYDRVAMRWPAYAKIYPFLELVLGLMFLGVVMPMQACLLAVILSLLNGYSIVRARRAGLKVNCACLGSALNVPLSTVSLVEMVSMGVMAGFMMWLMGWA